jgi:porphobilinogen synthase
MKNKFVLSTFPSSRGRRLRHSSWIRDLTSETQINIANLVQPVFIKDNISIDSEIIRMPGIKRFTLKELGKEVENLFKLGIKAIAIFPIVEDSNKSINAKEALNPDNLVCRSLRFLRKEFPEVGVICDIALDPFTLSGHDGVLNEDGIIDNDSTIRILAEMALNYSRSGCEIIAPSDMMDGRVKVIRQSLEKNGFNNVLMLSYSAKFCSQFYGPFRNALGNEKKETIYKDSYQLSFKNRKEAIKNTLNDIKEGADILMVKPAGYYLDIIREVKDLSLLPIAAYQVSGEYSMIKIAADNEIFDYKKSVMESLHCIKRSGADIIFSYFSKEVAQWLR